MMKWNVIETSPDGTPRTEVAQVPGGLLFRTVAWMNSPSASVSIATALQHVPCADEQARGFVEAMSATYAAPGVKTIQGAEAQELISKIQSRLKKGEPIEKAVLAVSPMKANIAKRKAAKTTRRKK